MGEKENVADTPRKAPVRDFQASDRARGRNMERGREQEGDGHIEVDRAELISNGLAVPTRPRVLCSFMVSLCL